MLTPERKRLLTAVGVALLAEMLLFAPLPAGVRVVALLVWAVCIPGHLLAEILGRDFGAPPTRLEWGLYAVGAGYAFLIGVLLLLSYVPGPLTTWSLHLAVDSLLLLLVATAWPIAAQDAPTQTDLPRWEIAALGAILLVAVALRLVNLGYAEFHGDEARAVLRGAAVIQGYADVLFLHKKGPAEILLPTAVFAGVGTLNEFTARLPFVLANLTAVAGLFWLGRRLFHPLVGLLAALLLALDGFMVAFARLVQYQSLVVLMSVLTLLVLMRLWEAPHRLARGLGLAALFLACGLWAHYEAGLAAIPAIFVLVQIARTHPEARGRLWRGFGWAFLLGAGLLALFYVPFVLHEQFRATYIYLVERRIAGDGLPANNIADLFVRLTTYSASYYALLLIGVTLAALIAAYRRTLGRRLAWVWALGLLLLLALTIRQPAWAAVTTPLGIQDWLVLGVVAALLPVWLGPGMDRRARLLWLWWGALFVILVFFTGKPRTHVYVFFPPWALLVGLALGRVALRRWVQAPQAGRRIAVTTGLLMGLAALVFGGYVYQMFAYTRVEILRTWDENWPAGYWRPYEVLDNRALFGFPLANGWKVVGQLYHQDEIQGDYATNEVEYWAPMWYTRGRLRCDDQATWFFQIDNPQPDPPGYRAALAAQLADAGYQPWAQVMIQGDPRMVIRRREAAEAGLTAGSDMPESERPESEIEVSVPQMYALSDYAGQFDARANADLRLGYPVVEPSIQHPMQVNLENLIRLEGYALEAPETLQPGDTLRLTLYWRALQEMEQSYKVFNQSYYGQGNMVAQQDGYPVCGSRGTWMWDPGELIADMHTIRIEPDAPDGLYPLYTGLYVEETSERLSVVDENGNRVADQVHLTDIRVGLPPE